jgi:ketopantoate reductase
MHIAVMAAGAVGGYFGARLAAAGHKVSFIARGSQLEAMRTNGLQVNSPLGNLHLATPEVTDDPARIGPVDFVLFAVKLWETEQAARQVHPLIGANTRVITFQNWRRQHRENCTDPWCRTRHWRERLYRHGDILARHHCSHERFRPSGLRPH